ncbi:MAG: LysR family transcriptional regulator [Sandaracinaceae bacterium]|nr:LysR family transcriptional regulator [Sandaracinaceae bacterium]
MSIEREPAAPRLDVRDLRVVVALGRSGTTAAAAARLHLTQSAVSRALAVAEAHAGVPLFTRTARGLVPTSAGAVLLDAAPGMLADLSELERRVREPAPAPRRLRLVAECHMAYPWLARVVLRLRRTAPAVRLEMPAEHSLRAAEALAEGAIDAALLTSRPPPGFLSTEMMEDELMFLVASDHPLAAKGSLTPRDIASHELLVPTVRTEDARFLRFVFGSRRPRLRVERLAITEAIVELARAGLGIAVLSEWVAGPYLDAPEGGLTALRLRKGPLKRAWRLAHAPELDATAPLLADAIRAAQPRPRLSRG